MIFTDIKAYMEADEVLTTHVRSSIGMKRGLVLANTTGIIDSDYYSNPDNDGNIGFMLRNLTDKEVVIKAGEGDNSLLAPLLIKVLEFHNKRIQV